MYPVLFVVGWVLSKLPKVVIYEFCRFLGIVFFMIPSKRRQIIYSNLHHAFPDRSPEWLRRTVRRICIRTAEMGLFTLVVPHFSKQRYFDCLEVPEAADRLMQTLLERQRPILLLGAHFSMLEATNAWKAISRVELPKTAIIYRPHKHPKVDALIKNHRERGGFELVSRKEGIKALGNVLRNGGMGALLFDQNTRDQGSLVSFFGRVTSATDLPGLLAKKYQPILLMALPRRVGFWQARLEVEEILCRLEPAEVTLAINHWLEEKLKSSDDYLVDWLWSHNRWKILFRPFERLGMNHRKKITDFSTFPVRKTRIALLHQEIQSEQILALEFLEKLRASRPDAEITLISRDAEQFQKQHRHWVDVAHDLFGDKNCDRKLAVAMRDHFLDVLLVMDDHVASRQFAKTTRVPQRFGVRTDGKTDDCLTDVWCPEDPYAWKMNPDWTLFGLHFGLEIPPEAETNPA